MKNIFMVMHGLKFTNGGITRVMLNRSHFITELGHQVNLVTFDDEEDYEALERQFKQVGRLNSEAKIINFFDYYKQKNTSEFDVVNNILNENVDPNNQAGDTEYLVQREYFNTKKFIRYFSKSGELVKCKTWSKDGRRLDSVDFYEKSLLSYSKIYKNNFLNKIIDYNDKGEDIQVRFFTKDGFCYFQRSFLGANRLLHLFIFDRKTMSVKGFNSYQKLHTFFLEDICDPTDKYNNIIICDGPGSTEKVALVSKEKAIRILTIHSNHLTSPYTVGASIKQGVMPVFKYLDKVDAVVVLTHSQLEDLVKQFGNAEKFHVIQNTVSLSDIKSVNKKWDNNQKIINVVSRYVGMKRLKDVVTAISLLLDQKLINSSDIKINFYGSGDGKKDLISYISSLQLSNIMSVNDYVSEVDEVFSSADITVMTSTYEGFGLTLIEAMSNKTPVISYDINYGPRDIINDGQDGFLVKANDIDALSEKIYDVLFENYNLLPSISENAFNKVKSKFSHEHAAGLWKDLLENKLN